MKLSKLFMSLALSGLMISQGALAGEKIDKNIAASSRGEIEIEVPRGTVTVTGWDKDSVQVSGELDDDMEKLVFERSGDRVEFKVKLPSRWGKNYGSSAKSGSNLVIYVPKNSVLEFAGVNTDVTAEQLLGNSEIESVNGDITAKTLKNSIHLSTVNGAIDSTDLDGRIQLSTVNGRIKDRQSKGKLSIETVNGKIESQTAATEIESSNVNADMKLAIAAVTELKVETVNGDIEINIGKVESGADLDFSSVSGNFAIAMPGDADIRADISAHAGGSISNQLTPDQVNKAKHGPSRSLKFSNGNGSAKLEISTVSGDITLKKI